MKGWLPALVLFAGLGSSFSFGQVAIVDCVEQRKLFVPRVQGQVFDGAGVPVSGALVSLISDAKPTIQATTDATGQFSFKVDSGDYTLKASYPGFETTTVELEVGRDLLNLFHPTALRVILSVGSMDCPWVTTSNKEFKGLAHKHALRK